MPKLKDCTIYCLPGLGADRRMYEAYCKAIPNTKVIEFIPHVKGESLVEYAGRMADQIDHSKPYVLLGTSMGGMISMEINRLYPAKRVILISTMAHAGEKPWPIKLFHASQLYRFVRGHLTLACFRAFVRMKVRRKPVGLASRMYAMAQDAQAAFVGFGVRAVVSWKGSVQPEAKVFRIHGSRDLLFWYSRLSKVDYTVQRGSHVAVISYQSRIIQAIKEELEKEY